MREELKLCGSVTRLRKMIARFEVRVGVRFHDSCQCPILMKRCEIESGTPIMD